MTESSKIPSRAGVFAPPKRGDAGIYKCRNHYHVGSLWPVLDWDDTGIEDLEWNEHSPGQSFEAASDRLMRWMSTVWA